MEKVEIELACGACLTKTLPGVVPYAARRVTFSHFELSFDDIESLVSNGGLVTITDRNQKNSVVSLQKQFDLVQNDKLAHLLHLAKYDKNFTKFGDSYKNLYYHSSTAKGKGRSKTYLIY